MSGPPPVQLDESQADQVAARFLDAPSVPQDPITATAYRLLELQTDRLAAHVIRRARRGLPGTRA